MNKEGFYPPPLIAVVNFIVPKTGLEPARISASDPKSDVSTYSTTWAYIPRYSRYILI